MSAGIRVIVCGGRSFSDRALLDAEMDRLHRERPIACVIEGGATGADALANRWAKSRGVAVETYPANWKKYGKAAGPVRNGEMLDEGRPDLVVAFAGGMGTLDMVRRAQRAGVEVHQPTAEADLRNAIGRLFGGVL